MNKKDIAAFRKQFKLDNELLKITDILHVYVKKETGEVYAENCQPFNFVEVQQQDLFMSNFKKVLAGQLDAKLFELKFERSVPGSTQSILLQGLRSVSTEEWKNEMLKLVSKMFATVTFTFDAVVTFIKGEYHKATKQRSEASEEGGNDEVYTNKFILCSINKTEQPKREVFFDYKEKEFKSNNQLDPIINLSTPLTGFVFPTFNQNSPDVNHILYSPGKANQPDDCFIEHVLNCEDITTGQDDKDNFERILKRVIGDKVTSTTIANVYEKVNKVVTENEEDEEPLLGHRDIQSILEASGVAVDKEKVELAFKDVVDNEKYELKANNLIPNYTKKSIKINTKIADVSISPKDLKNMKYIIHNGKKCLVIEIEEDAILEGFKIESQQI